MYNEAAGLAQQNVQNLSGQESNWLNAINGLTTAGINSNILS
jgi:hypothetical protein